MIPRAYRTERPARPLDPILARIEARVEAILPAFYCGTATVSPTSMGSAGLVRDELGRVAWDRVWTSFCDLALAGGPPHRGTLLRPATPAELDVSPDLLVAVADELARGIRMTTGLAASPGAEPGWLAVACGESAAWLTLAVAAENVSCRQNGDRLELAHRADFRVEKEVKNGVCALAKAWHYWDSHLTPHQQADATRLELCSPGPPNDAARSALIAALLAAQLPVVDGQKGEWVGVACGTEVEAGWKLRAIASSGVMCRRESAILYVPVPHHDMPLQQERVVGACQEAWAGFDRRPGTRSARPTG